MNSIHLKSLLVAEARGNHPISRLALTHFFHRFIVALLLVLFSFVVLCKIYSLVNQTTKKSFIRFCFHLNEWSKIRHAISIHECINCIELHYL